MIKSFARLFAARRLSSHSCRGECRGSWDWDLDLGTDSGFGTLFWNLGSRLGARCWSLESATRESGRGIRLWELGVEHLALKPGTLTLVTQPHRMTLFL